MIPIAGPIIEEEEKKAVMGVLESGNLAQGMVVKEFEEDFAEYTGTKYAVAASNGTTALHTALLAVGVGEGDEVVTTPFTFIATANSILYCNARPVFADIDLKTFNIDTEEIKEKITKKTKAIHIVHLYGQPCDMGPIVEICEDYKLKLIEDACQAHGAEYGGEKAGSFGDAACFSFYPTKNMTTGEGGMITTNSKEVAERAGLLRSHGSRVRYDHEILGYNYRMTDVAAAIGIEQLKKLDTFNEKRIENAGRLTDGLKNTSGLVLPYVSGGVKHVYHQYTIRVENRAGLIERLEEAGIGYGIHYPKPVHWQKLYRHLGYEDSLPEAEKASADVLSLPVHPGVREEDIDSIISSVKGAMD
jgi:dTDP-4-amino-4,6-dideoxygalactose transaminase